MNSDVRRASGIIVPADLATMPDRSSGNGAAAPSGPPVCYDPDGRRRILVTAEHVRRLDRLLIDMAATGQAVIMVCREDFKRADGTKSCGQPMMREAGGDGRTYVCLCTRIHVVK